MGTFRLNKNDIIKAKINGEEIELVKKEKWDEFNSTILSLGDLGVNSNVTSAISAVFDLEGFTNFCKQIDPQFAVPVFLKQFLNWFFQKIKDETKKSDNSVGVETWHVLPVLTKFLGDGILVIWDTDGINQVGQQNIIISCKDICRKYVSEFYPVIKSKVTEAPLKLRCGIAKGNIFSVGNGNDFVGPCINFASRLQKLPGASFAFSDRGFNVEENWSKEQLNNWIIRKVQVRGIGESELIFLPKQDFLKMRPEDREHYLEP